MCSARIYVYNIRRRNRAGCGGLRRHTHIREAAQIISRSCREISFDLKGSHPSGWSNQERKNSCVVPSSCTNMHDSLAQHRCSGCQAPCMERGLTIVDVAVNCQPDNDVVIQMPRVVRYRRNIARPQKHLPGAASNKMLSWNGGESRDQTLIRTTRASHDEFSVEATVILDAIHVRQVVAPDA